MIRTPQPDEVVFLKGRPPLGEFIGYVTQNDIDGPTISPHDLADEWREANSRIRELEATEGGVADSAEVRPLPPELENLGQELSANPKIQRSFGVIPFSLGVVDLKKVVVFQKQINLTFVAQLREELAQEPRPESLFNFVFSLGKAPPPMKFARFGPTGFAFTSSSMDFRAMDVQVLSPSQVVGYEPGGTLIALPAVAVGYGANVLQAVSYKGRLMLGNGSHRAYALYETGITSVPCLIQHATLEEELNMVFPTLTKTFDSYFSAPRPPMLKDYFDDRLRRIVHVPRKVRQIRVGIQVEQSDMPG
jgi:hypothetical protein